MRANIVFTNIYLLEIEGIEKIINASKDGNILITSDSQDVLKFLYGKFSTQSLINIGYKIENKTTTDVILSKDGVCKHIAVKRPIPTALHNFPFSYNLTIWRGDISSLNNWLEILTLVKNDQAHVDINLLNSNKNYR